MLPPRPAAAARNRLRCGTSSGRSPADVLPWLRSVAKAIVDGSLGEYYRYRTQPALTGRELVRGVSTRDRGKVRPSRRCKRASCATEGEHIREAALILEAHHLRHLLCGLASTTLRGCRA